MSRRRINQALWTLAAALCAVAVVVIIAGLIVPLQSDEPPGAGRNANGATTNPGSLPQLATIEPLWSMRLQGEFNPDVEPEQDGSRLAAEPSAPAPAGVPVT